MAILVTGGVGFIGSHTCVELLDAGYDVVVVDNMYNSKPEVIKNVEDITGKTVPLYEIDILNKDELEKVFAAHNVEAVIHFAGLKSVGESVAKPLTYYHTNITGMLMLCEVMQQFGVKHIVFSSSATVYGVSEVGALREESPLSATNPYGWTKLMIEQIFHDLFVADEAWSIALLRYFNPIGAHESGKIGEEPRGTPNNLMPYVTQVAAGKLEELRVFGDDYNTHDGTGVRDYIHVVDLAKGHLKALERVMAAPGVEAYNLGTGTGYSVLDVIRTFEQVNGLKIPYRIIERRPGDIGTCYADVTKASTELGWQAEKNLQDMCRDAWAWESRQK